MPMPRKQEPTRYCEHCGILMERKRYAGGQLEDMGAFKRRKYCSLSCANSRERPSHWETYHWRARKHRKAYCEACGSTGQLHAHHVDGEPKNNEPQNIQTLCVYCHNFLHATAARLGWPQPGRMPAIRGDTSHPLGESRLACLTGWTDCGASATPSSRKSPTRSDAG